MEGIARVIVININTCLDCPVNCNSGGFTPGGPIPLCGSSPSGDKYGKRELPWKPGISFNKKPCRSPTYVIPEWCPLERCE